MRKYILAVVLASLFSGFLVVSELSNGRESFSGALIAAKPPGTGGGTGGDNGNNGGGNGGGTGGDNGNNGGGNGGGTGGDNGNNGGGNGGGNGGDNGNNGGGNGGDVGPTVQGRGLRQHAAVLDHVLHIHNVHRNNTAHSYTLKHPEAHPSAFATHKEEEEWAENLHKVACSMFRYLEQVRRDRPQFRVDYVDWIVHNTARALGEDPTEVKAALLGFSHHHEHSAAQQRNIVESGCARGGDISAQEKDALAEEHDMDAHDETATVRFAINDLSTRSDLAFQVTESGAVFTDYGVSHEKEMHLLIVRDDLRHFSHVHPERDADGTWRVPFTPSAGGTYWFYADFVDSDIAHYTMRFERTYASDTGNYGFIENGTDVRRVGNYNVILEKTPYSDGTLFTYHIDDDSGDPPLLEAYLGEMAHGVLISPSGRFIHTHPSWAGDHIVLHLPKAPEETYRVFMQFQVQGEVITSEFDWVHEHAQH